MQPHFKPSPSIILVLIALNCFSFEGLGQNQNFTKNQVTIQAGIGFISSLSETDDYGIGITFPLKTPPLSFIAEFGIDDQFSVGGYFAVAKSDVYYQDLAQKVRIGSFTHTIIGARGLYHFEVAKKLDTYAGAMLGYNIGKAKGYDESQAEAQGITYTLLVGAKYYLIPQAGAFLELGYGVTAVNIGVNLKLL